MLFFANDTLVGTVGVLHIQFKNCCVNFVLMKVVFMIVHEAYDSALQYYT